MALGKVLKKEPERPVRGRAVLQIDAALPSPPQTRGGGEEKEECLKRK